MTDKEHLNRLIEAVDELNRRMIKAAQVGLTVKLDIMELTTFADPVPVYTVSVRVTRVTKIE